MKNKKKRLAVDIRTITNLPSAGVYVDIGDLIELYDQQGVLFYIGVDEDGEELPKPIVVDEDAADIVIVDANTPEGKEELNKALLKK